MRHARGYRRLNRTHEHRKSMFSNMSASLIEHEQIKTTLPKAKELRPIVEKLVTLAKKGDLSEAAGIHRKTLEARRRLFGPEHPSTLVSARKLAEVLVKQGE